MDRSGFDGPSPRLIGLLAFSGAVCCAFSLLIAAIAGGPYLTSAAVSPWIVLFAAGLLALISAGPFALELRLRERYADRDRRWDVAVVAWGAASLVIALIAYVAGSPSGFAGDTLGGAVGLIALIESGVAILAVLVWLLSN